MDLRKVCLESGDGINTAKGMDRWAVENTIMKLSVP
jgi:hypothetical protein